jgi:lipopolysaccharide transport system permease protein
MITKLRPAHTAVYTPASPLRHPLRLAGVMLHDLWAARTLAWRLVVRDISAQYRQTFLGYVWAILPPLMTSLVWIFLNYSQVVVVTTTDVPYPVYAFTGTVFWQLFMDSLNAPLQQINANRSLLSKINFPKEALLLSGAVQVMFSFLIKLILLVGVLLVFRVHLSWTVFLLVVPIFGLLLLGTTIGIFLVPVGFLYKDIQNGLVIVLGILMYITPVVYPPPGSGLLADLMRLNPLTPLIMTVREILSQGTASFSVEFILVVVGAALSGLVFWIIYRLALPIIAEKMDA